MVRYHKFTVTGSGPLPFDMLRYDGCYPASQADAGLAHASHAEGGKQRYSITLVGTSAPTTMRWASFGWKVSEARLVP